MKDKEKDIVIGISTYNELENLPLLVQQIEETLPAAHLFVVDDNSPDGTGDWCAAKAEQSSHFACLRREGKLGLGTATITTFQYAIEHNYRLLVNMDADLSHPVRFLPPLIEALDANSAVDVAVGSRYVPNGKIVGWPLHRRLMSHCVNTLARWLLRLPVRDCSGSFRCYRVETLRKISLHSIESRGYSFFEEILWHLRHAGAQFQEIPITFQDRTRGKSKINMREAINALLILGKLSYQTPKT